MKVRGLCGSRMGLDRDRIHGGADMAQVRSWVGLDVHAAKVLAATVDRETGELGVRRLSGKTAEVVAFCAGLAGPTRVAYEAGPTGFALARALQAAGMQCVVAAPGKIERPAQDRVKTDRRDAERLVRLLMVDGLHPAQLTMVDYLGAIDALIVRRDTLEGHIERLVPTSPWVQTVARLRCLRGIDTLSAVALCAEVGDWHRFARPGRLMSFLGLVPSENSSGERRAQGQITKTGSRHARRLLVEAAWHYRRAPAKGAALRRRQAGQDPRVLALSWKAQQRLHHTWRRLDNDRGKRRTIVAVAVARELTGFCWAIANAD